MNIAYYAYLFIFIFRAVFGNEEVQPVPPKIPSSGGILDTKHKLCPHSEGCLKYAFQVGYLFN